MYVKRISAGFSLIELLVVIAIIGILSTVVLASLNSARAKARDAKRVSDLKQLQLALELYYDAAAPASYPAGGGTVTAILGSVLAPTYTQSVPIDPLNTGSYIYSYQALTSAGAACGTAPCSSFVLYGAFESFNTALSSDSDTNVASVTCTDGTATPYTGYCLRP